MYRQENFYEVFVAGWECCLRTSVGVLYELPNTRPPRFVIFLHFSAVFSILYYFQVTRVTRVDYCYGLASVVH